MSPNQYHDLLLSLDRALFVFHESRGDLNDHDRLLEQQIAQLRSQVLRAESGHPFPFTTPVPWSAASSPQRHGWSPDVR